MQEEPILNRVAESGLMTINLETFLPNAAELVAFDLKDFLFMELILKEKDFRAALKQLDRSTFNQKIVAVYCSADVIIPMWAYMLVSATLQPVANRIIFGSPEQAEHKLLIEQIRAMDTDQYKEARVVVKGCGDKPIPEEAYLEVTNKLMPVAKSILFGEPCSTVPVYKKPA